MATPMSRYPDYRESRSSFGFDVLGPVIVEVEASSGAIGLGVSTGGDPACWIVEHHLARFVEGAVLDDLPRIWDQMYASTLFYGRKGIVVHAISAVDLALWDLTGHVREEPVYALLGGAAHDDLAVYATGPRPDLAREMGFAGGKLPLAHGPADGAAGLRANVDAFRQMRERVGDDFPLMYDCWMGLDVPYALELMSALEPLELHWLEEPLPPDDYAGLADLHRRKPRAVRLATGEHEATPDGFRTLFAAGGCDVAQPDPRWCGGLTPLAQIAALADAQGIDVVPHASGVYGYHFAITRGGDPLVEFVMGSAAGDCVAGDPLLDGEPVPCAGRIALPDRPGFGVSMKPTIGLERPHAR